MTHAYVVVGLSSTLQLFFLHIWLGCSAVFSSLCIMCSDGEDYNVYEKVYRVAQKKFGIKFALYLKQSRRFP